MGDLIQKLKITILTPSFNQGEYIEQTIKSVMDQNVENVEHIIIDGGSTDTTIATLKRYPHVKWVSERDEGQSDALNKGLQIATGDIIGWINSDDYYEPNIFENVLAHFQDSSVNWIVGNSTDHYEGENQLRKVESTLINYKELLKDPKKTRQPPTFYRAVILNDVHGFNKKLHYVMDYDLWIRLSKISSPKMVSTYYSFFRIHSEQKTKTRTYLIGFIKEIDSVMKGESVSFVKRKLILFKRYKGYIKLLAKTVLVRVHLLDKKYLVMNYSSRKWHSK
jgi:glycosyltransferase involved in cell wall biosynthesis